MNLVQDKVKQRNVTPNFLRFRRKSAATSIGKKTTEDEKAQTQMTTERTERSSSRASRSSIEAYQRRVLHLSKLKQHVNPKETAQREETEEHLHRKNHMMMADPTVTIRQSNSNEKAFMTDRNGAGNSDNFIQKLASDKKRNSASGKIINKIGTNKNPSNPKRTEESLQKEDQRAKQMNVQFMNNMMKNQIAPNFMNKLKMKKMETGLQRKKSAKTRLLNLIVPVKAEDEKNNYQIYGELGKGAYGLVRMGLDIRTKERVAIKIYEKKRLDEPNKIKNLEREINILAQLSHPTIAKLLDVIETQNQLYLILEYGGANSLYNYLLSKPEHRLSEKEAKEFIFVISEALLYLHDLDIVHRDIKAQNILINRHRQLKLIDFGFSLKCKKSGTIDTFCGTPTYMAPEIVSKIDHSPVYTDMWSLGILYYVLLQGNYPFRAKSQNELFDKIKKGHFQYIHSDISKESKRFIEGLLRVNHLQRLTIHEVLSKENRKWLLEEE